MYTVRKTESSGKIVWGRSLELSGISDTLMQVILPYSRKTRPAMQSSAISSFSAVKINSTHRIAEQRGSLVLPRCSIIESAVLS
jgi:hypothetical protein